MEQCEKLLKSNNLKSEKKKFGVYVDDRFARLRFLNALVCYYESFIEFRGNFFDWEKFFDVYN